MGLLCLFLMLGTIIPSNLGLGYKNISDETTIMNWATNNNYVFDMITDASGNVYAIMGATGNYNGDGADMDLYVQKWTRSSKSWGTPTLITTTESTGLDTTNIVYGGGKETIIDSPKCTLDNSGKLHILYRVGGDWNIYYRSYNTNTGVVSARTAITAGMTAPSFEQANPRCYNIFVDTDQNIRVFFIGYWGDSPEGLRTSLITRKLTGSTWGSLVKIYHHDNPNYYMDSIMGQDGKVYLVFTRWSGVANWKDSMHLLVYDTKTNSLVFATPKHFGKVGDQAPGINQYNQYRMAIRNDGTMMVVFYEQRNYLGSGTDGDIWAYTYNNVTQKFSSIMLITSGEPATKTNPQVSIDSNGFFHVIYCDYDLNLDVNKDSNIVHKVYNSTSGKWSTNREVISKTSGNVNLPRIICDNLGNSHITWSQKIGAYEVAKHVVASDQMPEESFKPWVQYSIDFINDTTKASYPSSTPSNVNPILATDLFDGISTESTLIIDEDNHDNTTTTLDRDTMIYSLRWTRMANIKNAQGQEEFYTQITQFNVQIILEEINRYSGYGKTYTFYNATFNPGTGQWEKDKLLDGNTIGPGNNPTLWEAINEGQNESYTVEHYKTYRSGYVISQQVFYQKIVPAIGVNEQKSYLYASKEHGLAVYNDTNENGVLDYEVFYLDGYGDLFNGTELWRNMKFITIDNATLGGPIWDNSTNTLYCYLFFENLTIKFSEAGDLQYPDNIYQSHINENNWLVTPDAKTDNYTLCIALHGTSDGASLSVKTDIDFIRDPVTNEPLTNMTGYGLAQKYIGWQEDDSEDIDTSLYQTLNGQSQIIINDQINLGTDHDIGVLGIAGKGTYMTWEEPEADPFNYNNSMAAATFMGGGKVYIGYVVCFNNWSGYMIGMDPTFLSGFGSLPDPFIDETSWILWAAIGGSVGGAAVIAIVIVMKKRKKLVPAPTSNPQ